MKQWHLARIGCAIALSWQAAVLGQPRELEHGVEWLPGGVADGMPIDGNSVLIEAPDGWIIVDSGRRPAHAQALLERVRASGKPLRTLINTQSQLDHAGGNATLRDAFPSLRVMAGNADLAAPDVVVRERATVELAGLGLGIGVERGAITGSDVWVYESNSQVLVAGDLVTLPVPLFTAACPERLADAIERLHTIRFRWLVPGHGEPLGRGQFIIYRESFERLLRCAASQASTHQCVDGWLRDAGGLFARDQQPMARTLLSRSLDEKLRGPRAAQCKP